MDVNKLTRDPQGVNADLKARNNGSYTTQSGCKIYVPANYPDRGLTQIGVETRVLGIHGIVVNESIFSTSIAPAMIRVEPDDIVEETIEDQNYIALVFEPESTVIADKNVVQNDQLLFPIYNEFIAKGKVPWYFNYEILGRLFEKSGRYAGASLGANHAIMELIAAVICRNPDNARQQIRHIIEQVNDIYDLSPRIVPMNNVAYGATNTTAKLIGAFWEDAVSSALTQRSVNKENIEDFLRRGKGQGPV